jgi:hypothetical protein
MRKFLFSASAVMALSLVAAAPALAQPGPGPWSPRRQKQVAPWEDDRVRYLIPNVSGTWYMNGNPNAPCEIVQRRPGDRAEFINENGSRAWGTVTRNSVWIPDWSDGWRQGLAGTIRDDRIVWPNGTYWSR